MPAKLVKQGHYILGDKPPCGTNGLATCVGLAINHDDEWFIAHIDCAALVKTKKDPMWQKVAKWVSDELQRTMSACYPNYQVNIVGGLNDFSAQAIADGIAAWVAGKVNISRIEWDGFEVTADGKLGKLTHEANNDFGDGTFSVPANP
jgi:hypothetical protein